MLKSKKMSLIVLLIAFVLVFGAFFASSAIRADALEESVSAMPVAEEVVSEKGGVAGYAALYFLADGVTGAALLGIHVSKGWKMALWLTMLSWLLALVAGIVLVLLARLFSGKDAEKPFNYAALLGLVFAVFCPVVGCILSLVGQRRAKVCDGGKLYYIGGYILGGIFVAVSIVLLIAHAVVPFLPF